MVVAFLALAKRERGSVTTAAETTTARLAADSALAAAQSQIAANILNTPAAAYNFGLLVSTNYINAAGFNSAVVGVNPTNVSYYYPNGNPVTNSTDFPQLIANLYLLPRAPVMTTIDTNDPAGRFYLDVNRNMKFEGNGPQPQIDSAGFFIHTDGTADSSNPVNVATNLMVGDPEWIGVLARPDQPHSANNPFIARYAFFAQPIGNSLDLNYIYNQALSKMVNPLANGNDGFMRNQGVGSWEINLAAFLADLNTNEWDNPLKQPYQYYEPGTYNTGYAFEDALSLLSWRYNNIYGSLASADNLFPNANNIFPYDNIDAYSDGPLQTTTTNINETLNSTSDGDRNPNDSWAGADNTNHFFALQSDIFDTNKNLGNFPSHLYAAGTNVSTYDRYTFYRMLAQLGTDSSPDDGKLNLNYRNVTNGAVVAGMETNMYPWTALEFFTNAADRMLRMYTTNWFQSSPSNYLWTYYGITNNYFYMDGAGNWVTNDPNGRGLTNTFGVPNVFGLTSDGIPAFGITNIPVQANGIFVYSPSVNRVLQLAANLYDASTTNIFPSVFRPVFWVTNQFGNKNIYIDGYEDVSQFSKSNTLVIGSSPLDIPTNVTALPYGFNAGFQSHCNIYGVPWIVGVKKGLPGFNQLAMVDVAAITRRLQISRPAIGEKINQTNQSFLLNINNYLNISFWNSYNTNYISRSGQKLKIYAADNLSMDFTNNIYAYSIYHLGTNLYYYKEIDSTSFWPGSKWFSSANAPLDNSFNNTNWSVGFMPGYSYWPRTGQAFPYSSNTTFDTSSSIPLPLDYQGHLGLMTTNNLQAFILDGNNVIDYVQLRGPMDSTNLDVPVQDPNYSDPSYNPAFYYLWQTNAFGSGNLPSMGIERQMQVSLDYNQESHLPIPDQSATAYSKYNAGAALEFMEYITNSQEVYPPAQAPYTPARIVYCSYLFQANDPLVHQLESDLSCGVGLSTQWGNRSYKNGIWLQSDNADTQQMPQVPTDSPGGGGRYQPWGINALPTGSALPINASSYDPNGYNPAYKDPLVTGSDYWDFPTNLYPSVGWIGRVHRGTPWQTVYLKANDIIKDTAGGSQTGINTWSALTGNMNYYDASNSAPVQDRLLFDLFTTRFNDNAVRGTLSVNQTNLASWSALFSGMVALSNSAASLKTIPAYTNLIINPAGVDIAHSAVATIVSNMYSTRTNMALFPLRTFTHAGDVLSVPALSEQSPFLNQKPVGTLTTANIQQYGISDEVYEWLPQQMMGLVRCPTTPRYVVYCYGQTLKPALNGVVTIGTYFGLCTNYQVTAESAVRAVIRIDQKVTATGTNYSTVVESYNVLPSN
jgi:hypothetical protein